MKTGFCVTSSGYPNDLHHGTFCELVPSPSTCAVGYKIDSADILAVCVCEVIQTFWAILTLVNAQVTQKNAYSKKRVRVQECKGQEAKVLSNHIKSCYCMHLTTTEAM